VRPLGVHGGESLVQNANHYQEALAGALLLKDGEFRG